MLPVCEQSKVLTVSLAAFDPKPFIRTFEAAVDKLIAVRKDVQAKTEQMEKSVRVAERDYSKKMAELNRGFEVRPSHTAALHPPEAQRPPNDIHRPSDSRSREWRRR